MLAIPFTKPYDGGFSVAFSCGNADPEVVSNFWNVSGGLYARGYAFALAFA